MQRLDCWLTERMMQPSDETQESSNEAAADKRGAPCHNHLKIAGAGDHYLNTCHDASAEEGAVPKQKCT